MKKGPEEPNKILMTLELTRNPYDLEILMTLTLNCGTINRVTLKLWTINREPAYFYPKFKHKMSLHTVNKNHLSLQSYGVLERPSIEY